MITRAFFIVLAVTVLSGCADKKERTVISKPSMTDIKSAIDRNVAILNEATGARINKLGLEWVEIDESCYSHLDYFAQNLIFSRIFYPENDFMTITCEADPRQDAEFFGKRQGGNP